MFVCSDPQSTIWKPDFSSSEQASPTWTRLSCGGVELCNSLEWVELDKNPVQVQICEACGTVGCRSGGYVHISRLGELVLWTTPQIEDNYPAQYYPAFAVRTFGAVAFPIGVWEPFFGSHAFESANHRAAADAWFPGPGRPCDPRELVPMLRAKLLACDTLETSRAIELVSSLLDELLARAEEPFARGLADPRELGARIETLYFDGPAEEDWPALAFIGETPHIAFSRELIAL